MEHYEGNELKEFLLGMILEMNKKTGKDIVDTCLFTDGWVEPDSVVDFCSCRQERAFHFRCRDCSNLIDENEKKQLLRAGWLSRILYVYGSISDVEMKPKMSIRRTPAGECVIVLTK